MREIGLWSAMEPNLHFLELSPTARWVLISYCKWSFSGCLPGASGRSLGRGPKVPLGTVSRGVGHHFFPKDLTLFGSLNREVCECGCACPVAGAVSGVPDWETTMI